ncbi:glutathione S-transferase Mu 5-like isoform X3 [Hydractinia symbiolongicarpus]|uniref:glutathione S-transferase Mu 5-like isoform X3 n=1 Tax=Hydractinia symbiolongicarpus TaxID=13093 RepID=UPI00254F439F|nr:glutathione S-transferase Mu 5-like isoform X3 [Hydractinia symbiolongicarpus]
MAPIVLAYWKIRGLAQPARLLLGYTKTDFQDKLYEVGDGPTYDRSCWFDVKDTLGLDFPNLPYLIDGDIKITQSNAVMRYLGRKSKMDGETEIEKVRVDIMENQAMDFRNGFVKFLYWSKTAEEYEQKRQSYIENIVSLLKKFDNFLNGRKFFASDKLTFVDFIMYELLDQHRLFKTDILQPYENLKAFMKSFEEIPEIAEFMKSEKCFKGPINNKMAWFK